MKALVIDDSKATRTMIRRILVELGMEVVEAGNGAEGLERLHGETIGVALVDWNMPVMNGLEFVQAVRKESTFAAIPLMMVTTEGEMSYVSSALEAGANEYLMKPFDRDALAEKLGMLGVFPEA